MLIGEFEKKKFDFVDQIAEMENLLGGLNSEKTLADMYPPTQIISEKNISNNMVKRNESDKMVMLYDVVYACVPFGGNDE